jgi:hypothetical protein
MNYADNNLKTNLSLIKNKLNNIENEFEVKFRDVIDKDNVYKVIEDKLNELVDSKDSIVKLNIGGKIFQTKISTMMNIKDTLFYKLIMSHFEENTNKSEELEFFFDRSYEYFGLFLDYLRTKKYDLKKYNKFQFEDILNEAEYYGLTEIAEYIKSRCKEIEFVGFESAPKYSTAGTHKVEDLTDRSLSKGICVQSPYYITIELNYEHEIDEIEIGGYNGNTGIWYPGNGSGSKILTSKDGINFAEVGSIPSNYGASIQIIKIPSSIAKFVKFQHTSYLGIGFLNLRKA